MSRLTDVRPLLVILDLDETLVYGTKQPLTHPANARVGDYHVYKRPHVDDFVASLRAFAQVAVWTSSSADYAAPIVRMLFGDPSTLRFVWSPERCIRRFDPEAQEFYWVKDLAKVRRRRIDLSRVLAVDDTARKLERNYGNFVRVTPFFGDTGDAELPALLKYLQEFREAGDVRPIEKRNWQRR